MLKEKINENEKQRLKVQSQDNEIHQLNQYSFEGILLIEHSRSSAWAAAVSVG